MATVNARSRTRLLLRRDQRAGVQVIESMIVGVLVVGALVAVATLDVPTTSTETFKRDVERLAEDSLQALATRPAEDTTFGSVLEHYVFEALAGDERPLRDYLNLTLPPGAQYNVYLDNGHGPPVTVIDNGKPPREAVAASLPLHPRLAHNFVTPQFAHYQSDVPQHVYIVPLRTGILHHDEGTTVEARVTFHEVDSDGQAGETRTAKTYGHTALRHNDAGERSWPSITVHANPERQFHIDATNAPQASADDLLGSALAPYAPNVYNLTFPIGLEETSGVDIVKGTRLRIDLPRGWELSLARQDRMPLANPEWTDWTFTGDPWQGTTITARLKQGTPGPLTVTLSANHARMYPSYPAIDTITIQLSNGAQTLTHLLVEPPGGATATPQGRHVVLSLPKPTIDLGTTYWGLGFTNLASTAVAVEEITVRQPEGQRILSGVTHERGTMVGTWSADTAPASFTWRPQNPHHTLHAGKAMALTLKVTNGHTTDNHYADQDTQDVRLYYATDNHTAGTNLMEEWNYTQRATTFGAPGVPLARIPPSDGALASSEPGWPDQPGMTYRFGAGTYVLKEALYGSSSYGALPEGALGDSYNAYEGGLGSGSIRFLQDGAEKRLYELGSTVKIQTDLSAAYADVAKLNEAPGLSVSDVKLRTSLYTPERAWKGIPSVQFEQEILEGLLGDPFDLHASDIDADGTQDALYVTTSGRLYALDGLDGTQLWAYDTEGSPTATAIGDLDGDGDDELVVGFADGTLRGFTLAMPPPGPPQSRTLFTHVLLPVPNVNDFALNNGLPAPAPGSVYTVRDVVVVARPGSANGPVNIVYGASGEEYAAFVQGLSAHPVQAGWVAKSKPEWRLDSLGADADVTDLQPIWLVPDHEQPPTHIAAASGNKSITLHPVDAIATPEWISLVDEVPVRIHRADLTDDDIDDLVVEGDQTVYTLTGPSGNWRPRIRDPDLGYDAKKAVITPNGTVVVVTGEERIMQNTNGLAAIEMSWPRVEGETTWPDVKWVDVQAIGETIVVMANDGSMRQARADLPGQPLVWEPRTEPPDAGQDMMGFYMEPAYLSDQGQGNLYRFDAEGSVFWYNTTGEWKRVGRACAQALATAAYQSMDCSEIVVDDWVAVTDGAGRLEHVVVRMHRGTEQILSHEVVSFDPYEADQDAAWLKEAPAANSQIHALAASPDGRIWISMPHPTGYIIQWKEPRVGAWTQTKIIGPPTSPIVSLVFTHDMKGYAVSLDGQVWHTLDLTTWVPLPVADLGTHDRHAIAETPDGHGWLWTEDLAGTPLYTPRGTSMLHFEYPVNSQGQVVVRLETVEALPSTNASVATEILVDVSGNNQTWTALGKELGQADDDGYRQATYGGTLSCSSPCPTIHVRFTLRNHAPGANPAAIDAGLTPMLRSAIMEVGGNFEEVDLTNPNPGATATWSKLHQAVVSPPERTPWLHQYTPFGGAQNALASRLVTASSNSLFDGAGASSVVITERSSNSLQLSLHEGFTGRVEPITAGVGLADGDEPQTVVVVDATDDDVEDVLFMGRLDGVNGRIRVWQPGDGLAQTSQPSGGTVSIAVLVTDESGSSNLLRSAVDGQIMSSHVNGGVPALAWSSLPADAQGHSTVAYAIPRSSLYGTVVVVSELSFRVVDLGGVEVVQAARLVNWFDVVPPGAKSSHPRSYYVELVAWFNE